MASLAPLRSPIERDAQSAESQNFQKPAARWDTGPHPSDRVESEPIKPSLKRTPYIFIADQYVPVHDENISELKELLKDFHWDSIRCDTMGYYIVFPRSVKGEDEAVRCYHSCHMSPLFPYTMNMECQPYGDPDYKRYGGGGRYDFTGYDATELDSPVGDEVWAESSQSSGVSQSLCQHGMYTKLGQAQDSLGLHQEFIPLVFSSDDNVRLDVSAGEMYTVPMRGYEPWPVIVCDEAMLPERMLRTRPVGARRLDGSYHQDFSTGGKNVEDRRCPVMLLGSNDFGWWRNADLLDFDLEHMIKYVMSGDNPDLVEAYRLAAEGHDLAYFKKILAREEPAMRRDIEKHEEGGESASESGDTVKVVERMYPDHVPLVSLSLESVGRVDFVADVSCC